MAVDVSQKYRQTVYSGGAINRATLTINGVVIPNSNIKKITISSPIIDTTVDYFYIGTFLAQKVEIEFRNANDIDLNGVVLLSIATKTDDETYADENGYEDVDIGQYYIDTSPEDYYKSAKITCYDKSILFKQNVDISNFFTKDVTVEQEATGDEIIDDKNYSGYAIINHKTSYSPEQIQLALSACEDSGEQYIGIVGATLDGNFMRYLQNTCELFLTKGSNLFNEWYFENCTCENYDESKINLDHFYLIVSTDYDLTVDTPRKYYILKDVTTLENIGHYILDEVGALNSIDDAVWYPSIEGVITKEEVCDIILSLVGIGSSPKVINKDITAESLLSNLCSYFLGQNMLGTYPNINKTVKTALYDNTKSGKYYISQIAEIMGSNAKIGRDGKLYLLPLKRQPAVTINALKSKSWELSKKYKISRVYYEDGDNIYENGTTTDNSLNIRIDNIFMGGSDSDRQTIIDNLYNELNGFEMYSIKNENYGDVSLDCWDILEMSLGENSYNVINDNIIVYEMNIATTINPQVPSKKKQEVTNVIQSQEKVINTMKTEIDQVNNRVTYLQERTNVVETELSENVYTKTETNTLIRDVQNGLTNVFTKSGGNNLLTNTAPYRILSSTTLESWEGNINVISEAESVVGTALKLLSGVASQTVESLNSGTYAIGFKYKRLIAGATLTISYNGRIISIDNQDNITYNDETNLTNINGEIKSFGEVTGNSFTISFDCSTDGGFEIYELRLVHGDLTLPWTQNQNELKSKYVNIGDGITIRSDQANTINKLDTNGMTIYNKTLYNESATDNTQAEVLRVTDEGIITEDLTSNGKSNISGMLVQRVNRNHVFITGIVEETI